MYTSEGFGQVPLADSQEGRRKVKQEYGWFVCSRGFQHCRLLDIRDIRQDGATRQEPTLLGAYPPRVAPTGGGSCWQGFGWMRLRCSRAVRPLHGDQ